MVVRTFVVTRAAAKNVGFCIGPAERLTAQKCDEPSCLSENGGVT
jgi:hypothetical protein